MARKFRDLPEQEILALAISLEEEDGRIYADFADGLGDTYPATAQMFREMQAMDTPFLSAAFQVVVGGVLVFLAGILIGSS